MLSPCCHSLLPYHSVWLSGTRTTEKSRISGPWSPFTWPVLGSAPWLGTPADAPVKKIPLRVLARRRRVLQCAKKNYNEHVFSFFPIWPVGQKCAIQGCNNLLSSRAWPWLVWRFGTGTDVSGLGDWWGKYFVCLFVKHSTLLIEYCWSMFKLRFFIAGALEMVLELSRLLCVPRKLQDWSVCKSKFWWIGLDCLKLDTDAELTIST